ncbi:MAG: hypothetical protein R3F62_31745 [Planctomycetota bacterium]
MSDERLRELERRWKETGAGEDETAYLLERVRVGNLFLFSFGYQSSDDFANDLDAEGSECVWIEAEDSDAALAWGKEVAVHYCAHHFPEQGDRRPGDYAEWIERDPTSVTWAVTARLPYCRVGDYPDWERAGGRG